MNTFAELDLTVRRLHENPYSVEMRSTLPDRDTINATSGEARFDLCRELGLEPGKYARSFGIARSSCEKPAVSGKHSK